MSRKKVRPKQGDPIEPGMSMRDIAAALGISTAKLCQYKRVAEIPEDEFERRLGAHVEAGTYSTAAMLRGTPVPAPGRLERARGIVSCMTADELQQFIAWLAGCFYADDVQKDVQEREAERFRRRAD